MTFAPLAITDPRHHPDAGAPTPEAAHCYALAVASLAAETRQESDRHDEALRRALMAELAGDGATLAAIFACSPSVSITRHLWRLLDALWRSMPGEHEGGVALSVFAIPVVVVAGAENAAGEVSLPATLDDPRMLASILVEHGVVGGNQTLALASALVAADAIDFARLPQILSWRRQFAVSDESGAGRQEPQMFEPAPMLLAPGHESVLLRFMVGTAVARPGAELLADTAVGKWGVPFTQALSRQIALTNVTVLAIPRAPQHLLPALQQGRAAQREISAQLFVGNAVRRIRAASGEPSAVISAHIAAAAPGGGELRLSLSSPFEPRDAEGFRCPLYALERPGDVAAMLTDLLRDCRVTDVHVLGGVHADRDATTGLPLLFKPGMLPDGSGVVH